MHPPPGNINQQQQPPNRQLPSGFRPAPNFQQQPPNQQPPPGYQLPPGYQPPLNQLPPGFRPPPSVQAQPGFQPPPLNYKQLPLPGPPPPGFQQPIYQQANAIYQQANAKEQAIASAVQAAAHAAAAQASIEWESGEKQRALEARKLADQAADAVDAQVQECKDAEQALAQARHKLEELERTSQLAHVGPPTEGGIAARWNAKGFGFIIPRGGGPDLFVHCSSILDGGRLEEGASVRYVRAFDEMKQRYRAEAVTGGVTEEGSAANTDGDSEDKPAKDKSKGRAGRGRQGQAGAGRGPKSITPTKRDRGDGETTASEA